MAVSTRAIVPLPERFGPMMPGRCECKAPWHTVSPGVALAEDRRRRRGGVAALAAVIEPRPQLASADGRQPVPVRHEQVDVAATARCGCLDRGGQRPVLALQVGERILTARVDIEHQKPEHAPVAMPTLAGG